MDLIRAIEQKLNLTFLQDEPKGNLCFATKNDELRQEFKLYFTQKDLHFFIKSFGKKSVIIPETTDLFWELVQKGKSIS